MAYREARYVRISRVAGCQPLETIHNVLTNVSHRSSQAKKPSLSHGGKPIFLQAPPQLEQATRPNLAKKVSQIVPPGNEIVVTSNTLPFSLNLQISYA